MLQEFKKFAMRGSVVDLAIGVIIGAAFGKIIDSMVNDIMMPIIGRIFGGLDFTNYFIGLTPAASQATIDGTSLIGKSITATATDSNGNTSVFSNGVQERFPIIIRPPGRAL